MRLLLPILLLAGLGVGYLALRRDPATNATGTGPTSSPTTASTPHTALELDGRLAAPRSAAAQPEAAPAIVDAASAASAPPENVNPEISQAPDFSNGVSVDAVGGTAPKSDQEFYAAKYRNFSRASREQSFQALRVAVDIELGAQNKDSAELAAEMKREMEWLQEHYDPETP